jgi:hypothetical protein
MGGRIKDDHLRKICPFIWEILMVINKFLSDGDKSTARYILRNELKRCKTSLQNELDKKSDDQGLPN